jgi:hypothetical protein
MTTQTTDLTLPADPLAPLRRMWADAPALTLAGLLMVAAMGPTLAAMAVDPRTLDGASVWLKPFKFELALSLYALTLAAYARWLPQAGRAMRVYLAVVAGAILLEMLWIGGASMGGVASHFNRDGGMLEVAYALAGLGAVTLTSASLVLGLRLARADTALPAPLHLGLWLGMVLTFLLTVPVAGYMSSGEGHLVGQGTSALALMGWSREAGDLRVAHFFATHALHALPLVGWAVAHRPGGRAVVAGAAVLWTALVAGTFAQALAGQPFLAWLG